MRMGLSYRDCIDMPWRGQPGWFGAILDPTSEVISFRTLESEGASLIGRELRLGRDVMIAIGDVDNLKKYVEGSKCNDFRNYGHIAGNKFMKELGGLARRYLPVLRCDFGAVASFGGDELLFVVSGGADSGSTRWIEQFKSQVSEVLPCGISFAAVSLEASSILEEYERPVFENAVVAADRGLMALKQQREVIVKDRPVPFWRGRIATNGSIVWTSNEDVR